MVRQLLAIHLPLLRVLAENIVSFGSGMLNRVVSLIFRCRTRLRAVGCYQAEGGWVVRLFV
jgi:hypothetical protein